MVGLRTLVLGGTVYLSRTVASTARDAGHEVVCLARGVSGTVPDGVRHVRADRDETAAYQELTGDFDAVVEVSNSPGQVRAALAALGPRAGHWTYVSTCNVYADHGTPDQLAEDAALLAPTDSDGDDPNLYGARNVACEQAVSEAMGPARTFRCRPGLIVGPGDRSVRFRYWPTRLARGGEILAPGTPDQRVQLVDVRDLADWIVRAGEQGLAGVYDAVSAPMPMEDLLHRVGVGVGTPDPQLTWVGQDFLTEQGVQPWAGPRSLPLWLPLPEYAGFATRDVRRSLSDGLAIRDFAATARDTLAWERAEQPAATPKDGGIDATDEAALLAAWHARS